MSSAKGNHKPKSNILFLSLGALGVVFGDIGTSPLYAIREIFFSHAHIELNQVDILGSISLVFWALTIIVSFKYVVYVLRADNDGEGGVFALYSLLHKYKQKWPILVSAMLIFAAGLLFGDGIITPAISVISAVEGLAVITSKFEPLVVPITIIILTGLFAIQSRGTAKIGGIFGPIILVWFASLGALGLWHTIQNPTILAALNPWYIVQFLRHQHLVQIMAVLGSVMLVVTGGEAMYADMGHFGRLPIRLSWFMITYPALVLNYLGQGAFLLSGERVINGNLFFSMVPGWALIPIVILSTLATIIASQALITGAFSLATQAISLNLLPYAKVIHTHHHHEGQIYVPFINAALYIGCIALVLAFESSSNLASAYGLAVSGVMVITSLAMIEVANRKWHWNPIFTLVLFIPLTLVDFSFLTANSLKFLAGGFVPVTIAVFLFILMRSWRWGQNWTLFAFNNYNSISIQELIKIKESSHLHNDKSMVFVGYFKRHKKLEDRVPLVEQAFWDRTGVLPKHVIFLIVNRLRKPHVERNRFKLYKFYDHPEKGSIATVIVNHGFMEEININEVLSDLARDKLINIDSHSDEWIIHVPQVRLISKKLKSRDRLRYAIYSFLSNNSTTMDQYWGLSKRANIAVQIIPVQV